MATYTKQVIEVNCNIHRGYLLQTGKITTLRPEVKRAIIHKFRAAMTSKLIDAGIGEFILGQQIRIWLTGVYRQLPKVYGRAYFFPLKDLEDTAHKEAVEALIDNPSHLIHVE